MNNSQQNINNTGFTETLIKNPINVTKKNQKKNNCKKILTNGKKTTRKYFIPSQFPKLTGLTQKYRIKKSKTKSS